MPPSIHSPRETEARALRWIAGYNLVKGALLLILAIGLLKFINKDIDEIVGRWMAHMQLDLENRHIAALLERLNLVTNRQLIQLSSLTFVYSGLFLTEGIGLLLRQRWAKYFTIVVTSSFIPFEIYELFRHFHFAIFIILLLNVIIVAFLIRNVRRDRVFAALTLVERATIQIAPHSTHHPVS